MLLIESESVLFAYSDKDFFSIAGKFREVKQVFYQKQQATDLQFHELEWEEVGKLRLRFS